ncbi:MAG: hypothetical protein Q4G33_07725 [bacterium]|nr:hypothetical protein [bacterium]
MYKNVSDLKREVKKEQFKVKICSKLQDFKEWTIRNRNMLITFTPIVIGSATTITKVVGKHINLRKEESVKKLYCYDRSLGHYWRLRRELSNKEWLDVDRRKKNGERLADILSEMKVLK